MNKVYYLNKLRNCPSTDILEIVTSYIRKKLPYDDLYYFERANDHRKTELIMNETYSEVPAEVWRLVC